MSLNFSCSIKINGQTFEMELSAHKFKPTFGEILPQIIKIVKLGANEDIGFYSHDFEIYVDNIQWIHIYSLGQYLEHKSIIYIKPKPLNLPVDGVNPIPIPVQTICLTSSETTSNSNCQPKTSETVIKTKCEKWEKNLSKKEDDIKEFQLIVMAIASVKNFKAQKKESWQIVVQQLKTGSNRVILTDETAKSKFHQWIDFYAKNYGKPISDPKHRRTFDLLKCVHKLNLSQIYPPTKPLRKKIESIAQNMRSEEFNGSPITVETLNTNGIDLRNKLNKIRKQNVTQPLVHISRPLTVPPIQPLVKQVVQPPVKPPVKPPVEPPVKPAVKPAVEPIVKPPVKPMVEPQRQLSSKVNFSITLSNVQQIDERKITSRLKSQPISQPLSQPSGPINEMLLEVNEKDVKTFQSIVMAINIGWDLKEDPKNRVRRRNPNWEKVNLILMKRFPEFNYSYLEIEDLFRYWTLYYAQNYKRLNNNLVAKHQKIFDLLKIVHILDLEQIFEQNTYFLKSIEEISQTIEFKSYFDKHLAELRKIKELDSTAISKPIMASITGTPKNIEENSSHETRDPRVRTVRIDPRLKSNTQIYNKSIATVDNSLVFTDTTEEMVTSLESNPNSKASKVVPIKEEPKQCLSLFEYNKSEAEKEKKTLSISEYLKRKVSPNISDPKSKDNKNITQELNKKVKIEN